MTEIFKDIKGYEGLYQVSNLGRVRRKKFLKQHLNKGYCYVVLCKNNKRVHKFTHRLVGEAFIPNPNNKQFINHKNGIKTDNSVENLEWCTRSENQIHAYKTGLQKPNRPNMKSIICVETNEVFECEADACFKYKIHSSSMTMCLKHRRKTCGGYHWRYE